MARSSGSDVVAEEIEVLASMFGDDLRTLPGGWKKRAVALALRPWEAGSAAAHVEVELQVTYEKGYPRSAPLLAVFNVRGLSDQHVAELQARLEREARALSTAGEPYVHQLAELSREFLCEHNKQQLSFYEQASVLNKHSQ